MKYAYWGFAMLLFGSIGLIIIVMFETITLNNDSEYYVLKEAMEAAMLESVDLACYRITDAAVPDGDGCNGDLKMSEQKFVENFTRRFAASIKGEVDEYTVEFYDVMEMPPKATVIIKAKNTNYSLVSDEINIYNSLSGILEDRKSGGYKVVVNEDGNVVDISISNPGNLSSDGYDVQNKDNSIEDNEGELDGSSADDTGRSDEFIENVEESSINDSNDNLENDIIVSDNVQDSDSTVVDNIQGSG